jgi:hypothetical protein
MMRKRRAGIRIQPVAVAIFCMLSAAELRAEAAPSAEAKEAVEPAAAPTSETLCELIEAAASAHGIPSGFFTRLLWKESRFRSDALSPKGAQGIAQFMPATAEERGLLDPFDVATAIPASASYLADLKAQFGNVGLAAAAYNAGPQRVADWIADTSTLPWETQDFVASITGVDAESWIDPEAAAPARLDDADEDCATLVARLQLPGEDLGPAMATATGPWGVQVAGFFSRARVMRAYARIQSQFESLMGDRPPMIIGARMRGRGTRIFYHARVPMQTREEANGLCDRIRAAGGSCVVLKT